MLLKEAVVTDILLKSKAKEDKGWADPTVLISAGAVLLTMASLTFSFYQFRRNRFDSLDWKERESRANRQAKLLESLKWFEGGIQTRAIGIAVIEGHWVDQPELRPTWASVLASQAVYIISKPEATIPQHEARNLNRILELLARANSDPVVSAVVKDLLKPINDALAELPVKATRPDKGPRLEPSERRDFIEQVLMVAERHSTFINSPIRPVFSEA